MTADVSQLSDADLKQAYSQFKPPAQPSGDVSSMSDEDLKAAYHNSGGNPIATKTDFNDKGMIYSSFAKAHPIIAGAEQVADVPFKAASEAALGWPEYLGNKAMQAGAGKDAPDVVPPAANNKIGTLEKGAELGGSFAPIGAITAMTGGNASAGGAAWAALHAPFNKNDTAEDVLKEKAVGVPLAAAVPWAAEGLMNAASPMLRGLAGHGDVYRHILNPGKGIINDVEVKSAKDLDQYYQKMADEKLIIKSNDGKIDTSEARSQVNGKVAALYDQVNQAIKGSDASFNLNALRDAAKSRLRGLFNNDAEYESALKEVDNQIDAAVKHRGEDVSAQDLNKIKQGMWQKGYDLLSPSSQKVARVIGNVAKDSIEKAIPDAGLKETNAEIGRLKTVDALLQKAHGQVVQGGKLGTYLTRGLGAAAGEQIGAMLGHPIIGTGAGAYAGGELSKFVNNPEMITNAVQHIRNMHEFGGSVVDAVKSLGEKFPEVAQGLSKVLASSGKSLGMAGKVGAENVSNGGEVEAELLNGKPKALPAPKTIYGDNFTAQPGDPAQGANVTPNIPSGQPAQRTGPNAALKAQQEEQEALKVARENQGRLSGEKGSVSTGGYSSKGNPQLNKVGPHEIGKEVEYVGEDGITGGGKGTLVGKDKNGKAIIDSNGKLVRVAIGAIKDVGKSPIGLNIAAGAGALTALKASNANASTQKPKKIFEGQSFTGQASTYNWGEKGLNNTLADNTPMDRNSKTQAFAAMSSLPMHSVVEVKDLKTGKTITVKTQDFGPGKRTHRVIDLSQGAWRQLGYDKPGLTNVKVTVKSVGTGRRYHGKY